jgi:hypothetical protein
MLANYFLRLNGRFGSSTVGAFGVGITVSTGASPNAGGALPKSCTDAAAVSTGAGAGVGCAQVCAVVYPCVGGGVLTHCGCAGTLTSGAVPTPEIFPLQSPLFFLYHE